MHGNLGPNVKTNECDVLIAVGMRFDDRVTGKLDTYARQAKIIHLDIDSSEIDKNVKVDVPVLGNCKQTLAILTQLIGENEHLIKHELLILEAAALLHDIGIHEAEKKHNSSSGKFQEPSYLHGSVYKNKSSRLCGGV